MNSLHLKRPQANFKEPCIAHPWAANQRIPVPPCTHFPTNVANTDKPGNLGLHHNKRLSTAQRDSAGTGSSPKPAKTNPLLTGTKRQQMSASMNSSTTHQGRITTTGEDPTSTNGAGQEQRSPPHLGKEAQPGGTQLEQTLTRSASGFSTSPERPPCGQGTPAHLMAPTPKFSQHWQSQEIGTR